MVFSSILFLCIFLPGTILLYFLLPKKSRNVVLLFMSLLFYAWGEPKYILVMLFSILFNYLCGIWMERNKLRESRRKWVLVLSVCGDLGVLCFFKYTDFAVENINRLLGTDLGLLKLALPIGISFYTFQILSYMIDVYRRKVTVQKNLINFSLYVCLFPQLIAGPIVRYSDIQEQLGQRHENAELFWQGLVRFVVGLGKKVLLANQIGILWDEISSAQTVPAATAWIGTAAFAFQIYFDFSGYSDMAIGLGKMFGFSFPENFKYPYEAESITDFWRRWHITLSTWFREYLYIPLGGNRKGLLRQILNLLIVWLLTGLWHGAGWNFALWGLFYFVLLAAEKIFLLKRMEKWPAFFKHLYSLFFIILGWAIFACEDGNLGSYFGSLFGMNGGADTMTLYYLRTYAILFLIMIIGSTELPKKAAEKIREKTKGHEGAFFILQILFVVLALGTSIVLLIGDSYNPFLYFRF